MDEWGDPADAVATAEGSVLAYDIDPFQAVEVLVGEGDIVTAIKIALASPLDASGVGRTAFARRDSRRDGSRRSGPAARLGVSGARRDFHV